MLFSEKKNSSIYRHSIFSNTGATETDKVRSAARDRLCLHSSVNPTSYISPPSVHPQLSHWGFCFSPLPLSHHVSFTSSPHSSFTCPLIQNFLPAPHLCIQSWNTGYAVTFCFILWQTPEGKPFQDISQWSNTPTLSLLQMWAHKPARTDSCTQFCIHTHTHALTCFHASLYTWILNLPRPIGFSHIKMLCVTWSNTASDNKSVDAICWRQQTAQFFLYRIMKVWMQQI